MMTKTCKEPGLFKGNTSDSKMVHLGWVDHFYVRLMAIYR